MLMRIIKRGFKETYLSYFDVELDHRLGQLESNS